MHGDFTFFINAGDREIAFLIQNSSMELGRSFIDHRLVPGNDDTRKDITVIKEVRNVSLFTRGDALKLTGG